MRIVFLPALLFGIVALPGIISAQEGKKPERVGTGFQPANMTQDLQHGRLLEITMKGNQNKIKGTLVRVDPNGERLYVRTQPGAAPQAIVAKDIDKIEKGVKFGLSKDNVKLVGSESDVIDPEIQTYEIINGTRRTVNYVAPTLSSGEKSMLQNLESAQNELAQLQFLQDRQQLVMDNAIAMQSEQRRTLELQNRYMDWLNMYLRRQDPITDYWTSSWGYNPYGYGYYNWPQGNMGVPWSGQFYGAPPAIIQNTTAAAQPLNIVIPTDALTKARQNLAAAQNAAVFERNRLVAVVVPNEK